MAMSNKYLLDMENLFSSSLMADLDILVNGETFKAHKAILSARNTVFHKMLEKDMIESCTSEVEIKDVDTNALKSYLKYLYTGKVDEISLTKELLIVADRFLDPLLKERVSESLKNSITPVNAAEMLITGVMYMCDDLKSAAAECISRNFDAVRDTDMYSEIFKDRNAVETVFEKFGDKRNSSEVFNIKVNWRGGEGGSCNSCGFFKGEKVILIVTGDEKKKWEMKIYHIPHMSSLNRGLYFGQPGIECIYSFVLSNADKKKSHKSCVQLKISSKGSPEALISEKREISNSVVQLCSYSKSTLIKYIQNNEIELEVITE